MTAGVAGRIVRRVAAHRAAIALAVADRATVAVAGEGRRRQRDDHKPEDGRTRGSTESCHSGAADAGCTLERDGEKHITYLSVRVCSPCPTPVLDGCERESRRKQWIVVWGGGPAPRSDSDVVVTVVARSCNDGELCHCRGGCRVTEKKEEGPGNAQDAQQGPNPRGLSQADHAQSCH